MEICFHCGDACDTLTIAHQDKFFCCHGCRTVYDILHDNELSYYYDLEHHPGTSPSRFEGKFDFLKNKDIARKLLDFDAQGTQVVTFLIPSIHCSSCIWILENLNKLQAEITVSQVNFPKKTVRITFSSEMFTIHQLAVLLARIGYEPYISLEDASTKTATNDRGLIYKLGVAGFAFGNIMFLSFPEYFEVNEFWLEQFKPVFRGLMLVFAIPVICYSAQDYFLSAYKGLRSKILNIDVPIAIGVLVLFVRSTLEVAMDWGSGFFDSMAGLVFFLLLGKFFQQKTYAFLSFERDYKSYFPIAITRLWRRQTKTGKTHWREEQAQIYDLEQGDRILIRNGELVPVDAILIKGNALIDYSFVTGEARPVQKKSGDKVFAGGRQQAGIIELEVLQAVAQSHLTQLWSNEVFDKNKRGLFETLTDHISRRFTISILIMAVLATLFWLLYMPEMAFNVFTAVLIVACPCAIALAAPFTLGNLLRIFGQHKLYLKNSTVIEQMAQIDTIVFDKTGTLTSHQQNTISYEGTALNKEESALLAATLRASNHPLSRSLYQFLRENDIKILDDFREDVGQGLVGTMETSQVRAGAYGFVIGEDREVPEYGNTMNMDKTAVHISSNDRYMGCYVFDNAYREGVESIFNELSKKYRMVVLSGDNEGERHYLSRILPHGTSLIFNQKPEDKLRYIKSLQEEGANVMMIGDGLNDAGALAQSNVGIAVSENVNVFSPACDGILDASQFRAITNFLWCSKKGMQIIKYAFVFSLIYNLFGLGFAITGNLTPVVAAILMPLSSISIVVFTTLCTYFLGKGYMYVQK